MENKGFRVSLAPQTSNLYSEYDLSLKKKESVVNHYINTIINEVLGTVSNKWFVEYSVLATTIDPYRTNKNTGQLRCYSFIQDNGYLGEDGQSFKDKIEKYISPAITVLKNRTEKNKKYWWFHNPETFLAPKEINPYVSFTNNDIANPEVVDDIIQLANEREIKDDERYKGEHPFYFSSLEYPRTFGDILRDSKVLAQDSDESLIKHYHDGVEEARLYYDKLIADKNETFCYVTFPIVASPARFRIPDIYKQTFQDGFIRNRHQGLGHCFIYFNVLNLQNLNKIDFEVKIESLFNQINEALHNFAFNYTFNLGLELQANARKEALKSAISAIMSRNMSHNLGSHYMYYTKAYLEQLANSVNDIAPDIRGAAKVLGYVQARMDYLATVISNDKYPYGAVNFKSQIFDELTVDDFSHRHFLGDKNKRTTNFLLTNLIYSENFTRPDVRIDDKIVFNGNKLFLYTKYSSDGHKYNNFTGTWHEISIDWVDEEVENAQKKNELPLPTITSEQDTKNVLSSLNIALPGGSMSCHAFFNIVENFIRNSAKYLRSDVNENDGLICTIAIQPNTDKKFVDIILYDNKKNANKIVDIQNETSLYDQIINKLSTLVIIDDQNKISKEDKGFKEMLFSAIWMRAYMFGDKTYADVVANINQAIKGKEKLCLIEKYGFSFVKVIEHSDGNISSFTRNQRCEDDANLGLKITLPVYNQIDHFSLSGNRTKDINAMLNMMADIVEVDEDFMQSKFNHVFTHSLCDKTGQYNTNLEKYRAVIKQRFPDIDKYSMSFGEKSAQELTYKQTEESNRNYCIYFGRHMDTQRKSSEFEGYAYADTISGGNFTITMLDLFRNGIQDGLYKDDDAEIFSLKIKESALTRITIIDERLYNSTKENEYPWLSLKNIRILNYDEESDSKSNKSLSSIFMGNNFSDCKEHTHFLSIHLGLIEKILKNSCYVNSIIDQRLGTDYTKEPNLLAFERVEQFMELLQEFFGESDSCILYIAVHSGRGNYSKELEGPLCTYPFISLSALENAYKNSKYQLSQLFYNTVFVGKGLANEQNSSST